MIASNWMAICVCSRYNIARRWIQTDKQAGKQAGKTLGNQAGEHARASRLLSPPDKFCSHRMQRPTSFNNNKSTVHVISQVHSLSTCYDTVILDAKYWMTNLLPPIPVCPSPPTASANTSHITAHQTPPPHPNHPPWPTPPPTKLPKPKKSPPQGSGCVLSRRR